MYSFDMDPDVKLSFFHDRYDMDFDDDVLYCYEIQLEESCRGKGLGKFMMKVFIIFIYVYDR